MSKQNKFLLSYIIKSISKGISEMQIKKNLKTVGWTAEDINEYYKQALINSGVPSPTENSSSQINISNKNKTKSSPMEISVNLVSFILLAITAFSTGILFYQIINKIFPDVLNIYSFSTEALHYSMAVTVVSFPAYYFSMYLWFRSFRKNNEKRETRLTKFLTYLVLIIATITILGNLIATVYTFLQGELSIRFFLKALVIFVLAGLIFGFYYLERKKNQYHKSITRNWFKLLGLVSVSIIVFGIIAGFIIGGSPSQERIKNIDKQRAEDLAIISDCIKNYATKYHRLPKSLSELQKADAFSYCAGKKDPETNEPYSYHIIEYSRMKESIREGEFELCANFNLASEEVGASKRNYYNNDFNSKWRHHSAGLSCDRVTVVLEYPSKQKELPPLPQ